MPGRLNLPLSALMVVAAAVPTWAAPLQKNGLRPEVLLPQTRARPPLDFERLYLGMREASFLGYARAQGWELVDQTGTLRRSGAAAVLYAPGGEALAIDGGESVLAQGVFVRVFFERDRLVGLQITPNFSEGGITLRRLQLLARAWFPDDRLKLRYQILDEDSAQQVIEALLGRIPEAFAPLTGRSPIPFQAIVLGP
jgi:hypothetical protein